ncbi:MAG: hypothetical protein U0931_38675 [Vulcanimicrobiota bacterium]
MSVAAVLLSLGESGIEEAYRSLQQQTLQLSPIIKVEQVSPFSAAFNRAVESVEAEFFLQCDADMVLAANCAQTLLSEMTPRTAVVVGLLDDPLQGAIRGVKLFRTQCCRDFPVGLEVDCETEQIRRCMRQGWELRRSHQVLGSHRLDLSDELYNFERFRLAGAKARQRQSWWDLTYRMVQLSRRLQLGASLTAAVALMAGLVSSDEVVHQRPSASPEYLKWKRLKATGQPQQICLDRPFCNGWQAGKEGRYQGDRLARWCLAQSSPACWLYLAGFVAAVTDARGCSSRELWPHLCGWSDYLERNFEAHRSGLRIWEVNSLTLALPLGPQATAAP